MKSDRGYHSPVRDALVEETRRRLAQVSERLFAERGYAATTIAAIAREAGVSAQTVYNAFGTKPALLKAAYDRTLVGDDEPVPFAERADVRALYEERDPALLLIGYARLGRQVLDRVGRLVLQIDAGAAAGEPDLVALRETTDRERLTGTLMVARRVEELGGLAPGLAVERARDRIWTLNSAAVWELLTVRRGWRGDEYEQWVGEAMCDAVLAG